MYNLTRVKISANSAKKYTSVSSSYSNFATRNDNSDRYFFFMKQILKHQCVVMVAAMAVLPLTAWAQQAWKDASLSFHDRAKAMVKAMTLDEKISQVGHNTSGVPRVGLNGYNYWNEGLHGVARSGVATSFPAQKAMSATWNLPLIYQCAVATSDEARVYNNLKGKGLTYWCPTINMSRDPRWGRDEENYGEDPWLCGRMAVEYIKGMQGDPMTGSAAVRPSKYYKTIATAKHFAANNYERGRHSTSSDMDERNLREYYLPAFEMSVRDGNVRSIMSAYNALNGVPCGAHHKLLIDILRTEWGFSGFVTSDCGAVDDVYENHKYVQTAAAASGVSMVNGEDLNCGSTFQSACKEAIERGFMKEADLDSALVRVLEARFSVGEFDAKGDVCWTAVSDTVVDCRQHRRLALEAARQSIVLMKNDGLLPLSADKKIAVIGPLGEVLSLGGYSGSPIDVSTPIEGIAARMGIRLSDGKVQFEDCDDQSHKNDSRHLAHEANGSAGNLGYIHNGDWVSFSTIDLGDGMTRLTIYSGASNSQPTVVKIYLDKMDGSPEKTVTLQPTGSWSSYKETTVTVDPTVFNGQHKMYFEFTFSGNTYGANMDWFRFYNENAQDPLQADGPLWYVKGSNINDSNGNDFETAKRYAQMADVCVLVLGTTLDTSDEGHDRQSLALPGGQQRLLETVYGVNKNVVLVLQTCSSVNVSWAKQHVPAIVEAWYGGQAQGHAIADVLFGDYNPAGRLTSTWYQTVDDLPPMTDYDIRRGHRTYLYYDKEPQYAFGHGLSYTTFEYKNLQLSTRQLKAGTAMTVAFDVTNTGGRDGAEVPQLYIRCRSQLQRPLRQLAGFDRIELKAGETRRVELTLRHDQLVYFNVQSDTYDVEAGTVDIMVGASSADIRLRDVIEAEGAMVRGTYRNMNSTGIDAVERESHKPLAYNLHGQRVTTGRQQSPAVIISNHQKYISK